MARTKPAEQRRTDLLDAAAELFVTKGIPATTLEDITTKAGASKGLFYLYFPSKEALVTDLQEQFTHQFAQRIRDAADAQSDWTAKLDACVKASFECYRELDALHEVLFHCRDTCEDAPREPAHAPLARALQDVLADGTAAGAYRVCHPEATGALFYAAIHAFDPGFYGAHPPPDEQLLTAAQELFRRTAGICDAPTTRRSRSH
jgi:TetR/AcrR family transcriptional repressor of nem operon